MTFKTLMRTQPQYSEPDHMPDHAPDPSGSEPTQATGSGENRQIGVLEGQWVPPPPIPEGTYNLVISYSTGPMAETHPVRRSSG